jgi:hypothetical protein
MAWTGFANAAITGGVHQPAARLTVVQRVVWVRQTRRVRGGKTRPCDSTADEFILRRVGVRKLPKLALSALPRSNLFPPNNLGAKCHRYP